MVDASFLDWRMNIEIEVTTCHRIALMAGTTAINARNRPGASHTSTGRADTPRRGRLSAVSMPVTVDAAVRTMKDTSAMRVAVADIGTARSAHHGADWTPDGAADHCARNAAADGACRTGLGEGGTAHRHNRGQDDSLDLHPSSSRAHPRASPLAVPRGVRRLSRVERQALRKALRDGLASMLRETGTAMRTGNPPSQTASPPDPQHRRSPAARTGSGVARPSGVPCPPLQHEPALIDIVSGPGRDWGLRA